MPTLTKVLQEIFGLSNGGDDNVYRSLFAAYLQFSNLYGLCFSELRSAYNTVKQALQVGIWR